MPTQEQYEQCSKCGRARPEHAAGCTCPAGGECQWRIDPGDLASHVDRVLRAVNGTGLAALVERLTKLEGDGRAPSYRLPFGLIGAPDAYEPLVFNFQPWGDCVLTHLVVTPETAAQYELVDFKIGSVSQLAGSGWEPLPLDTFSVAYLANDRLSALQAWKTCTASPGMTIQVVFQRRRGVELPMTREGGKWSPTFPFRGLLWADIR
jgi:hypothetical protein